MLKPLKSKVLIKPDPKKTETASGLFTGAYSVEGGLRRGTVISIGNGVKDLKVNDRVCFIVSTGNVINVDEQEHFLMYETEVIGWIEENE